MINFVVAFEVEADDPDEAFQKFQDMISGKTDYIVPTVTPLKDESYEAYTGIKPEGTI
jgi:hypothetical protein